jgi:hypothetical protein
VRVSVGVGVTVGVAVAVCAMPTNGGVGVGVWVLVGGAVGVDDGVGDVPAVAVRVAVGVCVAVGLVTPVGVRVLVAVPVAAWKAAAAGGVEPIAAARVPLPGKTARTSTIAVNAVAPRCASRSDLSRRRWLTRIRLCTPLLTLADPP